MSAITLEYQHIFDNKIAVKIKHQDLEIFPRNIFYDEELGVCSGQYFSYDAFNDMLYIRGNVKDKDDEILVVSEDLFEHIQNRINKLNIKYSILGFLKRHNTSKYYYINEYMEVIQTNYCGFEDENNRFKVKNCFLSREEAIKVANKIKSILGDNFNETEKNM